MPCTTIQGLYHRQTWNNKDGTAWTFTSTFLHNFGDALPYARRVNTGEHGCSDDATVDQLSEGERVDSNDMILMTGAHHCRTVLCYPDDSVTTREKIPP